MSSVKAGAATIMRAWQLLKEEGPLDITSVAQRLGCSQSVACYAIHGAGAVEHDRLPRPPGEKGRKIIRWKLPTPAQAEHPPG